jgi:hypothetical protein
MDIQVTNFGAPGDAKTVGEVDAMAMRFVKEAMDTRFWEPLVKSLEPLRQRKKSLEQAKRVN